MKTGFAFGCIDRTGAAHVAGQVNVSSFFVARIRRVRVFLCEFACADGRYPGERRSFADGRPARRFRLLLPPPRLPRELRAPPAAPDMPGSAASGLVRCGARSGPQHADRSGRTLRCRRCPEARHWLGLAFRWLRSL